MAAPSTSVAPSVVRKSSSADTNAIFFVGWPERFHMAERYADAVLMNDTELTDSDKLLLDSLRSQANHGPCVHARPSIWDKEGMARWSSWRQLKNMSKPEAMNKFVRAVGELHDVWWQWPPLGLVNDEDGPAAAAPAGTTDANPGLGMTAEEEEEEERKGEAVDVVPAGAAGSNGDGDSRSNAAGVTRATRSLARSLLSLPHGWQPLLTSGLEPRAHYRHAAAVVGAHMYVFGGRTHGGRLPDGVRVLDLVTCEWSAPEMEGFLAPRWAHTMNSWRHMVVVFGGHRKREYLNDVALLDTHNLCWLLGVGGSDQGAQSPLPPARAYHSAALIANTLYVFGGEDAAGLVAPDVHRLDLLTLRWQCDQCSGTGPPPVRDHVAAAAGSRMVVVGGCTASGYVDGSKLAVLETTTMTWDTLRCGGHVPSARAGHAAAMTPSTGGLGWDLCIFGGGDGTKGFADLFRLDLASLEWAKVSHGDEVASGLTPREGATCVSAGNLLVVFGGYTSTGCSSAAFCAGQGMRSSAFEEQLFGGTAAESNGPNDQPAQASPGAAVGPPTAADADGEGEGEGEGVLVLLASGDAQEVGAAQEVFGRALMASVLGVDVASRKAEWQPVGHDETYGAALQKLELLQLQLARAPPESPARRAAYLASVHAGVLPVSAGGEEQWFLFYWVVTQDVRTGLRASAMSTGIQLSADLVAKARAARFTLSVAALARDEALGASGALDVQELLTHRLMTLHAQLTEAWYSAVGALLSNVQP